MEETMLLPNSRKGLPLPARNAGESPIRNSTSRNNRRYTSSNRSGKDHSNSYAARHEQRHLAHRSDERGTSPSGRTRLRQQRSRSSAPGGARDPAVENMQHVRGKPAAFPDKIASSLSFGGSSSSSSRRREGGLEPRGLSSAAATTLRSSGSAVDGGLAGVGASLRSSWSALPAMPNGEAVPALLSHLAELRSMCQRQRDSGKSMRGALVRKQGELDEASAEASWLRAEHGFIVGDMLGALQGNPTPGTVFSCLSERIRCDLGVEEAAVYIDIGDGTLWLLPTDGHAYGDEGGRCFGEEIFIQRGVGVVGLVAMGAVPGAAKVVGGGGRSKARAGQGKEEVDILLLNDGLEAFDNGTTVEAALLRAARRRRSGGSCGVDAASATSGTVRNMLLARVGLGVESRGGGFASAPAGVGGSEAFPEPPTAVIQALNKQAAPERFTEGDARAVRTLAPAIIAGSRLIVSLLNFYRDAVSAQGGRQRSPSSGNVGEASAGPFHRCPEELLLREGVRRARDALGADRARVFVLDSEVSDGRLRLWHEDPLPPTSAWARSSRAGLRASGGGGGANLDADAGLQGVALSTGRATRSADALSDPLHDRALDLKEGFLSRSVLCAPLLPWSDDARDGACDGRGCGAPLGILQLTIGRGREVLVESDEHGGGGESRGSRSGFGDGTNLTRKKAFVGEDESLSEEYARDIARLLACLLRTGFRPRTSATTLAGGGGHAGAGNVAPTYGSEGDVRRSASWRRRSQDEAELAAERDSTANVHRYANAGAAQQGKLVPADLERSPTSTQAHAEELRPPISNSSHRDERSAGGGTSPRADSNGPSNGAGSRGTVGDAEARDGIVHGPLGSSTTSTAGPSPLGEGVRASVATTGQHTPAEARPPPSPATDDSTDGNSPGRPPNQEVQPPGAATEDTQARSWAAAHRVLEACKEGLVVKQSARHRDGSCGNATNSERLAPAVRSLVTSLLPGCTPVLLLFDSATERLWEAGGGPPPEVETVENHLPLVTPRPVRREDVARRALASGKALLAQAGERDPGQAVAATTAHEGGGSAGGGGSSADGDGSSAGCKTDSTDHESGERVFCVPVCGSAGQNHGVLQLFLPPRPPPQARLPSSSSLADLTDIPASTSPRGRSERGSRRGSAPSTPPPSFFMASKILADSVGHALGWCDTLDRQDEAHAAEMTASAAAVEAAVRAQELSRAEVEARHKEELRAMEGLHAARTAEAARAHALAVENLVREREAMAAAAAEAAARAKGRRDAGRALTAWRETSKRSQRAEHVAARMCQRRRLRAFFEWRSRTLSKDAEKRAEAVGAAASDRRGLRRALGAWAKTAVHERCVKERHLAGARLLAAWCRRGGRVRPYFGVWKRVARGVSASRHASAQKDEEAKRETLAHEELSRARARAKFLSDRVVELSQRRRRERETRSACQAWFLRARQLEQGRESVRSSEAWRHRRDAALALTRWRSMIGPADISARGTDAAKDLSKPDAGLAVIGSAEGNRTVRTALPSLSGCAASAAVDSGEARLSKDPLVDIGLRGNEDAENTLVARPPTDAAATPVAACVDTSKSVSSSSDAHAAAEDANDGENQPAVVEEDFQRLAQAAAGAFRQQREKLSAMRLFAAWRCAAARERLKRETLSRLLRHSCKHRLGRGFWRWHAEARDIRAVLVRQEAEKEIAVAALAEKVAVAANAAAETLASAREQELQRANAVTAGLQQTLEALQTEASGSALRQDAADSHLLETSARASLLSLAVARAFRQGRDRLLQARVLATMQNATRARRHASNASERIKALRLSRCLRLWRDKRDHARHRATASSSADAFAVEFSARITRRGAQSVLRLWSARATRHRQRQRGILAGVEHVQRLRKRAAVLAWRGAYSRRRHSATDALRNRECLTLSNARRGLERWRRVTFGDGGGDSQVDGRSGTGGRVLARLVGVAVKVDEAGGRRRAREALRRWLGQAEGARRRGAAESRAKRLLASGILGVALLRWRAASLIRLRLRRALGRGTAWAALHGARKGWCLWRARVQLAARRKALLATPVDTTAGVGDGPRNTCIAHEPNAVTGEPLTEAPTEVRRLKAEGAPSAQPLTPEYGHAMRSSSPTRNGIADGLFKQLPPARGGATVGTDVRSGGGSSNHDLLDLLVDVCAAPPPYSLGSGIDALGHDACNAAMRTFGLLSASLFEVVGGPQPTAVRVAAVQAGGETKQRSGSGGRAENSAAAAAVEAMAECGLPDRERLGDGTVGVAAQSARPVCVEVLRSSSAKGVMDGPSRAGAPAMAFAGVATAGVATAAALTVLCVPVMLQAAPLPKVLTGFVDDGDGEDRSPTSSVEVVGVLRAVRTGTGAFAGDDARALSAFCGQVALALVAERVLAESRASVTAEAAKEARVVRRQACRRVATLFEKNTVAGALLQRTGAEPATPVTAAVRTSRGNELWASVAGCAAQALGCERVDLLRVESLADGRGSGSVPVADLLSQRAPSRSFRRRSRDALLAARASSRSLLSSKEGRHGNDDRNEAISSWLCVPVLSPSGEGGDRTGGTGSVGRREGDGAVTVCCAVNKGGGRSFDDVDEAMLGTIAALYAVAFSWLPLPPPSEYSDTVPGQTQGCDDDVACGARLPPGSNRPTQGDMAACSRTGTSSPSAAVDCDHVSGIADRDVRTTGVNTLPLLGMKRSGNASLSPDAVLAPLNSGGGGGGGSGPTHFADTHRREQPSVSGVRVAAGDGRGKRGEGEAYAVVDLAGENAARDLRQRDKAKSGHTGEPLAEYAATQRPCFSSRPQPRFLDDGSYGENRSASSGTKDPPLDLYGQGEAGSTNATSFRARAINLASKEYAKLRDRAERAERMLETTRGRLCRALDDGASNAAAAAAATTTAATAADHVEDDGDDYGDNSDDSGKYVASDSRYREDESVLTSRRGSRRRHRERSAERLASIAAATAAKPIFRRSNSVDGSGVEKHDSPTRKFASSSDIWDGQGHYHTDDAGERLRRPAREQIGQRVRKEHRRRRRHSSSRCTSSSEARPEKRGQGGTREGIGLERKAGGGEPKRRRSKRRQQLRASDLTRMREVIARLRITTAELEAERAHRLDVPSAGVMEREAHFPSVNAVYASGDDSILARQAGGDGGGPSEEGAEAAVLQRENANLRRKLFGLMALEELEGRAVEKGLLPLTGGGVSGADFFSYSDKK